MSRRSAPRWIQIVHALPGRVRLRLSWLREPAADPRRVAEALAGLPGAWEVRVRPRTGSAVVSFDPDLLDVARILDEVRGQAGAGALILAQGEAPPVPERPELAHATSQVGRMAQGFFRDLDRDVLRLTDGELDLPTLVTLGLVSAGALEVAVSGRLPVPPWFNLAWWAFRTFSTLETPALRAAREREARGDPAESGPSGPGTG